MIVYDKFWLTLKEKGVTQYMLINKYKISAGQLTRIRGNKNLSTYTINTLCEILSCEVSDIMEYVPDKKE